jgi:hypothetical protein
MQGPGTDLTGVRRSDYDITNTVRVSSPQEVLRAVAQLFVSTWPRMQMAPIERAFTDFDALFAGRMPGYAGVDTVYHDRQHTLDVTLAMSRLVAGYERQVDSAHQLTSDRAVVGVILALFHDVGYLRRSSDHEQANGAEFTRNHVSRGAEFLKGYLPEVGLPQWASVAAQIIHFTGYEKPFDQIVTTDPRDRMLGHLLAVIWKSAVTVCIRSSYSVAWRCRVARELARYAMPRGWICCARRRRSSPRRARRV